jgi:aerobic carbon-monoxide dehydrogenase large subunit
MVTSLGDSVRRVEDPPMVTGSAHYTDDLAIPGALHAVFVRSVVAHARITGLDTGEAAGMPGVVAVLTAADLDLPPLPPGMGPADFARPALAREVVRFLGEGVAVVAAATREQALDAAEAVAVEYEPLPVVTDPVAAVEPDAPLLFPDHGSNVAVEAPWKGARPRSTRPRSCCAPAW